MICLNCNCEDFHLVENGEIEQIIDDRPIMVKSSYMQCNKCNHKCLIDGQVDMLLKAVNVIKEYKKYE